MKDLVLLYDALTYTDCGSRDVDPLADPDPLHVSPETRARFWILYMDLEALQAIDTRVKHQDASYASAISRLRVVALPELHKKLLRGSACIDELVKGGKYYLWWACEGKRSDSDVVAAKDPCDNVPRDHLRTCARVSQSVSVPGR